MYHAHVRTQGFSTWAGVFSCGVKIGASDNGVSTSINLSLPMRHVFYPSSLTARTAPFEKYAGNEFRAVWAEYTACIHDENCRESICGPHMV